MDEEETRVHKVVMILVVTLCVCAVICTGAISLAMLGVEF